MVGDGSSPAGRSGSFAESDTCHMLALCPRALHTHYHISSCPLRPLFSLPRTDEKTGPLACSHSKQQLLVIKSSDLDRGLPLSCENSMRFFFFNLRYPGQGGFPAGSDDKASACNEGDPGSIPGMGRSPGEGNGNPLQYSCLENPMDRGAWWLQGSQRVGHN